MIITPNKIFIQTEPNEIVPKGLIGIYNGVLDMTNIPTKKGIGFEEIPITDIAKELVFKGIKIGDTIYPNWDKIKDAGKEKLPFENIFEEVETEFENVKEEEVEVDIPDVQFEDFILGLPNNESKGFNKVDIGMTQKSVSHHKYWFVNKGRIPRLKKEKGRFAKSKNTGDTYYCNGNEWIKNIG